MRSRGKAEGYDVRVVIEERMRIGATFLRQTGGADECDSDQEGRRAERHTVRIRRPDRGRECRGQSP